MSSGLRAAVRDPKQPEQYSLVQIGFGDTPETLTMRAEGVNVVSDSTTYIRTNRHVPRIRTFERVRYCDLFPRIDLELYRVADTLEFDFLVQPGGNPTDITIDPGTKDAWISSEGDLHIRTAGDAEFILKAPRLYQLTEGERRPIQGQYLITESGIVKFSVGPYDVSDLLVIDPVLRYVTYISGTEVEEAFGVFVDASKNVYVTGATSSPDLPPAGTPAYGTYHDDKDVFVTKFSPSGTCLFTTYIGGPKYDEGTAVTADLDGNVYVTGRTSPGWHPQDGLLFPVTPGAHSSHPYTPSGVFGGDDSFVTKLLPDGSDMVFSAIVAGSAYVTPRGIALDAQNNVVVAGQARTTRPGSNQKPFPFTVGAYSRDCCSQNAFVYKLQASGSQLLFATFYGGSDTDTVEAVAVDRDGSIWFGGETYSPDLPMTSDAFQSLFIGPLEQPFPSFPPVLRSDGYVAKLRSDGEHLLYASYVRGGGAVGQNHTDRVNAIAIDPNGDAYIAGYTESTNFPTKDAYQSAPGPGFLLKLGGAEMEWQYSTYLPAEGEAVAANADAAYVVGVVTSADSATFPKVTPTQPQFGGAVDAVLMRFGPSGSSLEFSTFLGGSDYDAVGAVTTDANGNAYVIGGTYSDDFPTTANAARGTAPPTTGGIFLWSHAYLAIYEFDRDGDGLIDL